MAQPPSPSAQAQQDLHDLYLRPGFLLRRAHQIASAMFMAQAADLGITTTQYGLLIVLAARQPIDQISVARHLRLDRSTTGLVIRNLEERGLIERVNDPADRRRRVLRMTDAGADALDQLRHSGRAAHDQALSVFDAAEAQAFVQLLARFVAGHDDSA